MTRQLLMPEVLVIFLVSHSVLPLWPVVWNQGILYERHTAPLVWLHMTTRPSSCCITNEAATETRIGLYAGMFSTKWQLKKLGQFSPASLVPSFNCKHQTAFGHRVSNRCIKPRTLYEFYESTTLHANMR